MLYSYYYLELPESVDYSYNYNILKKRRTKSGPWCKRIKFILKFYYAKFNLYCIQFI